MTGTTGKIKIEGEGLRFYEGVAAGTKVNEAWASTFAEQKVDLATRTRVYWFYVGLLAGTEYGLNGESQMDNFLAGASTRAPQGSEEELPDDWPEQLTDEQQHALDDLVHDAASIPASDINNDGPDAQLRYLLSKGQTYAFVRAAIGLDR